MKRRIKNIKWGNVLIWGALVAIYVPFMIAAGHAVFSADDFTNALNVPEKGTYFFTAIWHSAHLWKCWQGTWFSVFVLKYFCPLRRGGLWLLRLLLILLLALSLVAVSFFARAVLEFFDLDRDKTAQLTVLILFPVLAYREYYELYLWWTASCVYFLPLSLLAIGFGLMLMGKKRKKLWMTVVAAAFMFAVSGGVLNIAGFGCFAVLLFLVGAYLRRKRIEKAYIIPFIAAVISAAINAFAPGNFVRYNLDGKKTINIFETLWHTVTITFSFFEDIMLDTTFCVFLLLALLFGVLSGLELTKNNLLYVISGAVLSPVVTMFPMVMGYRMKTTVIANRGYGAVEPVIYVSFIILFICLGAWIRGRFLISDERLFSFKMVTVFAIMLSLIGFGNKLETYPVFQVILSLKEGRVQEYAKAWEEIYSLCEGSHGEDLVIEKSIPERYPGCSQAQLTDDAEDWINCGIAEFYGMKSVVLTDSDSKEGELD